MSSSLNANCPTIGSSEFDGQRRRLLWAQNLGRSSRHRRFAFGLQDCRQYRQEKYHQKCS